MIRKILRNKIKHEQGNNKINQLWRNIQIKKYGIDKWLKMFNKCNRRNKASYLTRKKAYFV